MGGCACSNDQQDTQTVKSISKVYEEKSADPTIGWFIQNKLKYPMEKHVYHTKDGYLNSLFRIPGPKGWKQTDGYQKKVVIYQHGLIDCCIGIIANEEDSLGIKLVNKGYDLWLNNSRGNRYSRDHQQIELDNCTKEQHAQFYDFSFSEMGEFDQPALWDYVLKKTEVQQITYIGHSQGTCQMFSSLTQYPEFYKKHMKKFIALAPILRVQNMNSQILQDLSKGKLFYTTLKATGPEIMTDAQASGLLSLLLTESTLGTISVDSVTKKISDGKPELMSKVGKVNFLRFYPAGTSYNCMLHFTQMMKTDEFKKLDRESPEENLKKYGQETPPFFNLDNIQDMNIVLVCGKSDLLSSPKDYLRVNDQLSLKNKVEMLEFDEGHLALVFPENKSVTERIFQSIDNDD